MSKNKKSKNKKLEESPESKNSPVITKEDTKKSSHKVENVIKKEEKKFLAINWRKVIVRILITSFAIAISVFILPRMEVVENRIYVFIILGITFGIINALLKPIIEFFTFAFAYVTMGISIILLNGILLLIMGWLFPSWIQIEGILPALLGGIFIGVISTVLEAIFGVTPPIEDNLPKINHTQTYSKVIQKK